MEVDTPPTGHVRMGDLGQGTETQLDLCMQMAEDLDLHLAGTPPLLP